MQEQLLRTTKYRNFALLSTKFYRLKIDHLIKHNGIRMLKISKHTYMFKRIKLMVTVV